MLRTSDFQYAWQAAFSNFMASMAAWVGRMSVWFHVGTTLLSVALL
jgi:hypothetical protein